MSKAELNRLELVQQIEQKMLTQQEVAKWLGVTDRQVRRLVSAYRLFGAAGLISKKRGQPSNHAHSPAHKEAVMNQVAAVYRDFAHIRL